MSQEPNIDTSKTPTKADLPMPVPRRLSNRPAENINPNSEEVFGNTGPDSGFALKIVNKYENIWEEHPRKKLITSIVTNLMIYRSSSFGRAPTVSDFHLILGLLRISNKNHGELTKEVLDECSKDKIKGIHLTEKFNFLS